MKAWVTMIALSMLWIAGVLLVIAPFLFAGLALAYGELGLGAVLFGLGLLQAAVFSSVVFATKRGVSTRKLSLDSTA